MDKQTKLLDEIEQLVIEMVFNYLKQAMPGTTKEQARNLVGKIGARIIFGTAVFDEAFSKSKKNESLEISL